MASRLQDVIQRGTAAARPLATAVAPGTLYYSTDTVTTDRSNGTIWETFADAAASVSSINAPRLAAPFVVEAEELAYELFIPGPPGTQGPRGQSGSSIPFFTDLEDLSEPQIPISGPASSLTIAQKTRQIDITIDNNGSVITTGVKGFRSFQVAGTITKVRMLADVVGSIVVDIWKDTFANYPPTVADTITAAAKPTISATNKSEDTTLTGWTKSIAAGDVFGFNVDSATTITRLTLELTVVITG